MADHGTISVLFQILGDRLILGGPGGTTPRDAIRGGRGPLRPNERRLFIMARNAKEKEKRTAFSPNRCCRDIQSRPRQPSDVQRLPVHAKWGPLVAASGLGRRLPRPLLPCTGGVRLVVTPTGSPSARCVHSMLVSTPSFQTLFTTYIDAPNRPHFPPMPSVADPWGGGAPIAQSLGVLAGWDPTDCITNGGRALYRNLPRLCTS